MSDEQYKLVSRSGAVSGPYTGWKIRKAFNSGKIPDGTTVLVNGKQVPMEEWLQPLAPTVPLATETEPVQQGNGLRIVLGVLVVGLVFSLSISWWAMSEIRSLRSELATDRENQKTHDDLFATGVTAAELNRMEASLLNELQKQHGQLNSLVEAEVTSIRRTMRDEFSKINDDPLTVEESPDSGASAGELITNSIGMKLKLIPAGEFLMGSPADEAGHSDDETQHRVRITKAFYLGIHEVTRGQFAAFVKDTGYQTEAESDGKGSTGYDETSRQLVQKSEYTWRSPGFPQTDDHPVVHVSWNDAQKFVAWLNGKERLDYRLPTEAEWEYACRAGRRTKYSNGDDPERLATIGNLADSTAKANFPDWGSCIAAEDGYVFTAAVGQFHGNDFGLHDMHGNVWEWCQDAYDSEAYDARTGVTLDPVVQELASIRVNRGGSWNNGAAWLRAAIRGWFHPDYRSGNLGFRLARSSVK